MTKQVHSNSLADCFEIVPSEKLEISKTAVSAEVKDLNSKIPNRVGPVKFQKWLVLEEKVLETVSV